MATVDASLVVKLVVPDPLQERCRTLIDELRARGLELVAPVLWTYETTSALTKAVRAGQLLPARGLQALSQIMEMGVRLVPPDDLQHRQAFDWTVRLKRSAAYDSYYLALAETLKCDLWTADRHLVNAVGLPWVRWVGDLQERPTTPT